MAHTSKKRPRRPDGWDPHRKASGHPTAAKGRRPEDREILPRPTHEPSPEGARAYAALHKHRVEARLADVDEREPADVTLAISRAATDSADAANMGAEPGERIRVGVTRDVFRERGIEPLGHSAPVAVADVDGDEGDGLDVPHGEPLDGHRTRLGGRRR